MLNLSEDLEKKLRKKYKDLFAYDDEHILAVKMNCPKCSKIMGVRSSEHEVMYRGGKPTQITGYRCGSCGNQDPAWVLLKTEDGSEVDLETMLNPEPVNTQIVIDDKEEYEAELARQKKAREEAIARQVAASDSGVIVEDPSEKELEEFRSQAKEENAENVSQS